MHHIFFSLDVTFLHIWGVAIHKIYVTHQITMETSFLWWPSGYDIHRACHGKIHHAIKNGVYHLEMGHLYHGYVK